MAETVTVDARKDVRKLAEYKIIGRKLQIRKTVHTKHEHTKPLVRQGCIIVVCGNIKSALSKHTNPM